MARVSLDLDAKDDLQVVGADGWRRGMGMVPANPTRAWWRKCAGCLLACPIMTIPVGNSRRAFRKVVGRIHLCLVPVGLYHARIRQGSGRRWQPGFL